MTDDIFDFLSESIEETTQTPEEEFCANTLLNSKLDQLTAWLSHHMYMYYFLTEDKHVLHCNKLTKKEINNFSYGRMLIEYYLHMYHLPKFQSIITGGGYKGKELDLEGVISIIISNDRVKGLLNSPYNSKTKQIPGAHS